MKLNGNFFPPLFEEVRKVQGTLWDYCLAGDSIPLPKDNLWYAVEQEYNVTVEVRTVPLGSSSPLLRGMIEIYEDRSVIYIDGELGSAWTRYVFAKEICHHLVNNDEFRTANPLNVIEPIVLDETDIDGDAIYSPDVATEFLTKFAAVELLFPFEMRARCLLETGNGTETSYSIAEHFDIPEHLVQDAAIMAIEAVRDALLERHAVEIAGTCEGCERLLFVGEQGHYTEDDGCTLCVECSPTWGDIKRQWDEPGVRDDPEARAAFYDAYNAHIANGGDATASVTHEL